VNGYERMFAWWRPVTALPTRDLVKDCRPPMASYGIPQEVETAPSFLRQCLQGLVVTARRFETEASHSEAPNHGVREVRVPARTEIHRDTLRAELRSKNSEGRA
jgi:hypothetical protein